MPAPRQPSSETVPLLSRSSTDESLAEGPGHKHGAGGKGKGALKKDAHARDETHDDDYRPEWVPNPRNKEKEKDRPRTLIVCFDGTGDQFDSDNSNVVQFLSFLMKSDPKHQLVYYQAGIGTYNDAGFVTTVMTQVSKTLDSMFAWNLASHVQDGYHFLMQNYTAGDRISIFGFSRGAYTARALAGMIQRVGLLPAGNARQIPFAWSMYTRDDPKAEEESKIFKKTFSANVIIDFVGVWDTVASVGLVNKELPFVRNNTAIRVFRHALALDEHRVKFLPNYYHAGTKDSKAKITAIAELDSTSEPAPMASSNNSADKQSEQSVYPKKERNTPTDACEVWFAGCHCDVGGGSVPNDEMHALARIPLRWMIRECYRMKTGIVFDAKRLETVLGLDINTLYPKVEPRGERIGIKRYPNATIEPRPARKGSSIVTFLKAIGAWVWFPIGLLYNILSWPFGYVWHFITGFPSIASVQKETSNSPPNVKQPDWWYKCKNEEDHEFHDALAPIYDQLQIRWYWKFMEYIPMRIIEQTGDRDTTYIRCNKGLGRTIAGDACHATDSTAKSNTKPIESEDESCNSCKAPTGLSAGTYKEHGSIKVHRSVLTRLEVSNKYKAEKDKVKYTPLARYNKVGKDEWYKEDPDANTQWEWVE